jgi:tetratricopeptide (TPR) repeat protein
MVAALCRRLDGLPLALELVAPQLKILPLATILERLAQGTTEDVLVTPAPRDLAPRHRSLFLALDGSYHLLPPAAQRLFRALGVCAGSSTIAALTAIWRAVEPGGTVEGLLAQLVESSLLQRQDDPETARFGMLATVRDYATARLAQADETAAAERAYAAYYYELVLAAEVAMNGTDQPGALARLSMEQPHLAAVLTWLVTQGEATRAWDMAGALWRFWWTCGLWTEGRRWYAAVLALGDPAPGDQAASAARAKALNGAGILAWYQEDYPAAHASHLAALALRRQGGDPGAIAGSLNNLAMTMELEGAYAAAEQGYTEALDLATSIGDHVLQGHILGNLGMLTHTQGYLVQAETYYTQTLALYAAHGGDPLSVALTQSNLGVVLLDQGRVEAAEAQFMASKAIHMQMAHPSRLAMNDHNLGQVAHYRGERAQARTWYAASLAGVPVGDDRQGYIETLLMLALLDQEAGDGVAAARGLSTALELAEDMEYPDCLAHVAYHHGMLALEIGDDRGAGDWLRRSLTHHAATGGLSWLDTLDAVVVWASRAGSTVAAIRLAAAAAGLRVRTGAKRWPHTAARLFDPTVMALRQQTDAPIWAAAWADGMALPAAAVLSAALDVLGMCQGA